MGVHSSHCRLDALELFCEVSQLVFPHFIEPHYLGTSQLIERVGVILWFETTSVSRLTR